MKWRRALGTGLLAWLIPFGAAVAIFPTKKTIPALFESLMAVVLAVAGVILLRVYLRGRRELPLGEAVGLGLVWVGMSWLLDWPLFATGPMKMSLGMYFADIGVTYFVYPALTVGFSHLLQEKQA